MKTNTKIIQKSFPKEVGPFYFSMLESINDDDLRISNFGDSFTLNGQNLILPCRIYCEAYLLVYSRNKSNIQKLVTYCILTRHHNGYIRERYLKEVISSDEVWVIPFIVQLLGEYVIEIIQVIYDNFEKVNKNNLVIFIKENSDYWLKIKARVMSYWNCYYRWKVKKSDYVGFKVLNKIEEICHESRNNK